jgi:GNAT superfamily N-acetyltransferase
MPVELMTHTEPELPPDLKCQILAFQRIKWPGGFSGENRLRDWIHNPRQHPTHFTLVDEGVVISYAGVLWTNLEHEGETYRTYGLSGVLTYPAFGRQGYGSRVVTAATDYIRRSDADVGLFTCSPHLKGFYSANGWIPMEGAVLFGGPRSDPYPNDELVMMGFFSEKGELGRPAFESRPIYFDGDLW